MQKRKQPRSLFFRTSKKKFEQKWLEPKLLGRVSWGIIVKLVSPCQCVCACQTVVFLCVVCVCVVVCVLLCVGPRFGCSPDPPPPPDPPSSSCTDNVANIKIVVLACLRQDVRVNYVGCVMIPLIICVSDKRKMTYFVISTSFECHRLKKSVGVSFLSSHCNLNSHLRSVRFQSNKEFTGTPEFRSRLFLISATVCFENEQFTDNVANIRIVVLACLRWDVRVINKIFDKTICCNDSTRITAQRVHDDCHMKLDDESSRSETNQRAEESRRRIFCYRARLIRVILFIN